MEPIHLSPQARRALQWSLGTLAAVLGGVIVALVVLANTGALRGRLAHYLAGRTGRQIRIDGPLELHLLTAHPSVIAHRVVIGNPTWSAPGNLAEIDTLSVAFDLPSFEIQRLELAGATLRFQRDSTGRANWLWKAPGILPGDKGLPVIHELSVPSAHLEVADKRRNLQFDGTVSTEGSGAAGPLRIVARGHLNGRDAAITLDADPLATATRAKPYHFTFDERSSGSHLTAKGALVHGYDLRYVDAEFSAKGTNLRDSYYLLGARLPITAAYEASGNVIRRNTLFELSDLVATTGESDARVNITSRLDDTGLSHIDIHFSSRRLRSADLGAQAASGARATDGAQATSDSPHQAFPETPLPLEMLRGNSEATIDFDAEELDAGKLSFHGVTAKITLQHGTLTIPQLSGKLADGNTPAKITANGTLDAQTNTPAAKLNLHITNLRLGRFARKDPAQPPVDGMLQVRANLTGHGRSLHDLATTADGTITAALPQGTMRAALAELAGIDLRGLGLMLTQNKHDTEIRCGVATFRARDGALTSQTLVLDTDPVLITGAGTIQLDTQALDLQLEGHPKELRILRLSAPVAVQGTLAHPTFHVEGHKKLQLVDPGHAQDVDCGSLLAEATK